MDEKIKDEFAVTATLGHVASVEAQPNWIAIPLVTKSGLKVYFSFMAKRFLVFTFNVFDFSVTYLFSTLTLSLPSCADLS